MVPKAPMRYMAHTFWSLGGEGGQRVHAKVVPASAENRLLYEIATSPLSLLLRTDKADVSPNAFHVSTLFISNFLWSRTV